MKLADFIAELEKKSSEFGADKLVSGNGFLLTSTNLRMFEKKLFECDEFKNVVRINYLDLPSYAVDEETGEPIGANRDFLGGKTITHQVSSFRVNPDQEIKFNKIVDLYTITLNKRFLSKEDVSKPGIWVYPTMYDQETFITKNQIRIIWEPQQLEEALKMVGKTETPKQRLMRMFEAALDNMEPNLPCEYVLTLRCSSRSIANTEEVELRDEVKTITVEVPSIQTSDGGLSN